MATANKPTPVDPTPHLIGRFGLLGGRSVRDRIQSLRPGLLIKKSEVTDNWATGVDLAGMTPGTFGTHPQPKGIDVLKNSEFGSII